jgi:hypothetical protein
VLFDLIEDAKSFDDFKTAAEKFYFEPDADEEKRWTDAVRAIRAGGVHIEESIDRLPKEDPENRPTFFTVSRYEISRFNSEDNVPDKFEFAAAA